MNWEQKRLLVLSPETGERVASAALSNFRTRTLSELGRGFGRRKAHSLGTQAQEFRHRLQTNIISWAKLELWTNLSLNMRTSSENDLVEDVIPRMS